MFEGRWQWAVTIPGELRRTGSRSLVHRGDQPSLSWECLKDLNDPKPSSQAAYEHGTGGKMWPVAARSELRTAGWKNIQLTPLTASCNGILCLIFILGVSHTPVTSLMWLFCEMFTLQGQDVLPPNPFYFFRGLPEWGGSSLAVSAAARPHHKAVSPKTSLEPL